jgi:hypothetical protein
MGQHQLLKPNSVLRLWHVPGFLGLNVITIATGVLFPQVRFSGKSNPDGIKPDPCWFMQV